MNGYDLAWERGLWREGEVELGFYSFYPSCSLVRIQHLLHRNCHLCNKLLISSKTWLAIILWLSLWCVSVFGSGYFHWDTRLKQKAEHVLGGSFYFPCPSFLQSLLLFLLYVDIFWISVGVSKGYFTICKHWICQQWIKVLFVNIDELRFFFFNGLDVFLQKRGVGTITEFKEAMTR